MLDLVDFQSELDVVADAAGAFAGPGEAVTAVVPTEPSPGRRIYVCAFDGPDGRTWLAFDATGAPVTSRALIRDSIAIAAACEIAEETGGDGGDTDDAPLRLASPAYLDELGAAHGHGVAMALGGAAAVADELVRDVESQYKLPLT
jgi:hypothetical protein